MENIIKGRRSIINVGTKDSDKINGSEKDRFKFLKNSISSNKFNIIPRAKNIKIVFITILKKFKIKY